VTAIAGGALNPSGNCGSYVTSPCLQGVGRNNTLDFSNITTARCFGLQSCTFEAGYSASGALTSDFCYGFSKFWSATGVCVSNSAWADSPATPNAVCTTGLFLSTTMGQINCVPPSIIGSISMMVGGIGAFYGSCQDGSYDMNAAGAARVSADLSPQIRVICANKSSCLFPAGTSWWGDPAFGTQKMFIARAMCGPPPPPLAPSPPPPTSPPPSTSLVFTPGSPYWPLTPP
jgi:hypothetical protein